jgi:hypothetical protein
MPSLLLTMTMTMMTSMNYHPYRLRCSLARYCYCCCRRGEGLTTATDYPSHDTPWQLAKIFSMTTMTTTLRASQSRWRQSVALRTTKNDDDDDDEMLSSMKKMPTLLQDLSSP